MANKPFSIQAPEEIAKEYGGNKQKIAQGMQAGLIDPTAGVLAGMFIDRMRGAQMQEMQPSPTVAQQVMGGAPAAPVGPPAAGGLGALPPPAPSMTPPMGPPGAPPMLPGMADGGYLPPYASGGLSDLPVPDAMFDEPGNGGYGGGGIVAFATGSPGQATAPDGNLADMFAPAYQSGLDFYGQQVPAMNMEPVNYLREEARKVLSPEDQKRQRNEDKWMTLAQIGFGLASSSSPYFLQALGAAASAALPGAAEAKKAREARKREAIRDLAAAEDITRKEAMDRVNFARSYAETKLGLDDKDLTRKFEVWKTGVQERGDTERANIAAGATMYAADQSRQGYESYGDRQIEQLRRQAKLEAPKLALKSLEGTKPYDDARLRGDRAATSRMIRENTDFYYRQLTGEAPSSPTPSPMRTSTDKAGRAIVYDAKQQRWVYP